MRNHFQFLVFWSKQVTHKCPNKIRKKSGHLIGRIDVIKEIGRELHKTYLAALFQDRTSNRTRESIRTYV